MTHTGHIGDPKVAAQETPSFVTFREAFWVWVKISLLSFGGPAGQIALMHRILVDEKKWISESRFLHALNYCMLLPGQSGRLASGARLPRACSCGAVPMSRCR